MPKRKRKGKQKPHQPQPKVQSLPSSHQDPIMLDDPETEPEPEPEPQSQPTDPDPDPDPEPQSQPDSDPQSSEPPEPHPPQQAPEAPQEREEPHDMVASSAPTEPDLTVSEFPAPAARKNTGGGKRKKAGPGKKRLAEIQEKLALLSLNLRPVPFAPAKCIDVSKHERLFRVLGLWDFAHLRLDTDIRADLLAHLIANYDPPNRRSSVHGKRIAVSRADLARALCLPVKKDRAETDLELFTGEEAVGAITDFVMNWVLFQEDAWILPKEVVAATQLVKEGQPHKVDWAGLMWTLVEKELVEAPKSGECYYASHLQCLIKHQRPELFSEEPKTEPELELEEAEPEAEQEQEQEPSVECAPMEEEEDDAGDGGTIKTKGLEEICDMDQENHSPALTLGFAGDTDIMDVIEECKGKEGEQLLPDGKNAGFEHCLRPCNMNDIRSMECENLNKEEEEVKGGREEERFEVDLTAKFSSLERLSSVDLIQAVEAANSSYGCASDPYSASVQRIDPTTGDFLVLRTDTDKNMSLDSLGASPLYHNDGRRGMRGISDIDDEDEDVHRFTQGNNQQKRMRTDGHWEHATSAYDICTEQVQSWMGKAKMLYAEKEQAFVNAQLEIQYLSNMLEQKDQIINSLEKTRSEEQRGRDLEFCRFEHELKVMSRLVLGYKKALRETRSAFTEYRKQFPQGEEPLYKDVPGSSGLVLSARELERQRLQKEQEMRPAAVEMINNFQKEWFSKLNGYCELIYGFSKRVVEIDTEVQRLQEIFIRPKGSDT